MGGRDVLSGLVKPSRYNLALRNLDFAQWTYDGTVTIGVELTQPSKIIIINGIELKLKHAQVLVDGAVAAESSSFHYDDKTQRVTIDFENELPASKTATIVIAFQGAINDSMQGFSRSKYKPAVEHAASVGRDQDGSHYALNTQFQVGDARRAFPCFDEPNLKATFDLSIEVPTDQVALSNMSVKTTEPGGRDGWHVVSFETTPIMSTYLFAWAIGDFGYVEAFTERKYNGKQIPVRCYAVRGTEEEGKFALTVAPKVIDLFSDIFGIDYPLEKMDLLSVPEMYMGAMENWGLIMSRPTGVLFSEKTSIEAFKPNVAANVIHEIAHSWFGNLVTMDWWDELWLNEGFATWVCFYAVDKLFPEWSFWAFVVSEVTEMALQDDGLRSSHPLRVTVHDSLEARQIFTPISYFKGCTIIGMLASYVGLETFFKGVSNYLKANAYGNSTAQALWKALDEASGKNVGAMAESWINNAGHPVLTVVENPDKKEISVTQTRFLTSGNVKAEDDKTLWLVPLGIKGAQGGEDTFLTAKQQVISDIDLDFYKLNAQGIGFYRVNYPPSRLAKLSTQLDRLTTEDKVSIIASTAALASAGSSSTASLLAFLQGFRQETHPIIWEHIVNVLGLVDAVFSEDAQIREGLNRFTCQLIGDKLDTLGMYAKPEDDYLTRALRGTLQVKAVRCGHVETLDKFMPVFNEWVGQRKELDPSVRRVVFRAAMRKDSARSFKILKEECAKSTSLDGKMSLLNALAVTDDEEIIRQLVAFNFAPSLSDESVSISDMRLLLMGLEAHPVGRHIQWQYMKDNWDAFLAKVNNPDMLDRYISMILHGFTTKAAVADIDAFFKDKDTEGFSRSLENSKEDILNRASGRERDSEALKAWLVENKYIL